MWDLIVSVPDHCLSFYFGVVLSPNTLKCTFTEQFPNILKLQNSNFLLNTENIFILI